MRSPRVFWVVGVLAWMALTGCEVASLSPPPDPARIALQPGDLPPDLQRCPGSGPVDQYLRSLPPSDAPARDELLDAWRGLQRSGAVVGSLSVYAAQPAACAARVGTGDGPTASSFVIRFRDEASAEAAYRRGVLGFPTPSEDQVASDMVRGVATGFGRNAWLLQRSIRGRSLLVALWERHTVATLFVAVDVDPLHGKQAAARVDGRIP